MTTPPPIRRGTALSLREVTALSLAAVGYRNAEIARELHITVDTVKTHLARAMRKLDASDRTDAVVRALRSGDLVLDADGVRVGARPDGKAHGYGTHGSDPQPATEGEAA